MVLVADGPVDSAALEDRLVNIRRGTSFDSKALYYLPSTSTAAELSEFAKVLFNTIHPSAIEYYRDLSKHARRKRNRNSIPLPTIAPGQGTSSILSLPGWNVRYEFKLGIFAETRQELEAAARNFEQAYDGLFHAELLDSISLRSARFNEARLLADIIAIRLIRCALWSSQTAAAARWWLKHRDRMHSLLERRGMSTQNYSWEAWQTIWSKVMAELLGRAQTFSSAHSRLPPGNAVPVQILSERVAAVIDRSTPCEAMHHEGYWLNIAGKHVKARRDFARLQFEDESAAAKPDYKTYLAPSFDVERQLLDVKGDSYMKRICDTIAEASQHFESRLQSRMVEQLRYQAAMEQGESSEAVLILKNLWQRGHWRKDGWWQILAHLGGALLKTLPQADDETALLLMWELANLTTDTDVKLQAPDSAGAALVLDHSTTLPNIVPTLAFASSTGHVGEKLSLQLSLTHSRNGLAAGFRISEVKIAFDGNISPIVIHFEQKDDGSAIGQEVAMTQLTLEESDITIHSSKRLSLSTATYWKGTYTAQADFQKHHILNFEVVPKAAGQVVIASITILLQGNEQEITLSATDLNVPDATWWELRQGHAVARPFGMHRDVTSIEILPKPPKAEIKVLNPRPAYYTNEEVDLQVEVTNNEEAALVGKVSVSPSGAADTSIITQWLSEDDALTTEADEDDAAQPSTMELPQIEARGSRLPKLRLKNLLMPADIELRFEIAYHLQNDPSHTLLKSEVIDIPVVKPFEASVMFQPRVQSDLWPDFFSAKHAANTDGPTGLKQRYHVRADVGCFAHESIQVRSMKLSAHRLVGDAICEDCTGRLSESPDSTGCDLVPSTTTAFVFNMELQKLVLGDRAPVAIDFAIDITWSRAGSNLVSKTTLALPKFLAPTSEPRVLLQAEPLRHEDSMYLLTYTIENPSMHFLTFNVTMESGDNYAFSGPKNKSISLVPVSRYEVKYHILMQKTKDWIRVHLDVLDAFFGQTLRVQPASEGVRVDKQGQIQIWAGD